jgi:DNA repair exonuclease SbcCD ATPase subunit
MILDYIRLENFGAYEGYQEAILTPEDGRPVILFGGMNGGGKTTLLDAMQLALYGSKAKVSNRGRMGYRDYHKALAPFVARHYRLAHDETLGHTHIKQGYFESHEATR